MSAVPGTVARVLTIMESTGERKLGRKSVFGSEHPGLELARMPLHLVAVFVDAAEEIGAAVYVEHDAVTLGDVQLLSSVMVLSHLNPFSLQRSSFSAPLPPRCSAHGLDTPRSELCVDALRRPLELRRRYFHFFGVNPTWHGYPLRGEGL